jgi:hypothetical protein
MGNFLSSWVMWQPKRNVLIILHFHHRLSCFLWKFCHQNLAYVSYFFCQGFTSYVAQQNAIYLNNSAVPEDKMSHKITPCYFLTCSLSYVYLGVFICTKISDSRTPSRKIKLMMNRMMSQFHSLYFLTTYLLDLSITLPSFSCSSNWRFPRVLPQNCVYISCLPPPELGAK